MRLELSRRRKLILNRLCRLKGQRRTMQYRISIPNLCLLEVGADAWPAYVLAI
jgi:hypothetical protein